MTKHFLGTIILIFIFSFSITAQTNSKTAYSTPSRDNVMLQIGYTNWSGAPDSIKIGGIGRAFGGYITYDFPISKSNFSFAAGLGAGISNIYLKDQVINRKDSSTQILFEPETTNYKKYKLTNTYIEVPFELRYFSDKDDRNKGVKAALGLKVGALVSSYTKGKYVFNEKPIIDKISTKRYMETMHYAATARIGYGNFSLYGQYSIGGLFKTGNGPENVRPYQIGLCLSGL
ncbi:MAG: outer membrane beta-barrel protein [Chitinophagaceae bacterium]|nr:MAG: hypothetical protein UZ11_BCD004002098 [Bacteroidetes bacterium OLB11]MCC6448103.1 outer membrane beta-barrel protein [Chitinophagaceae bacterium]HMN32511.1 outer membrane beta-barrel protein [Chitinophagaceae bacterium]